MEENVEELIREAVEAAGVIAEVDEGTEQELVSLAANPQPFPPPVLVEAPDQVQEFQASIAQCLRLIENSLDEDFTEWERLEECVQVVASHPRVSEKMKMRCFLINRDNVRTYRLRNMDSGQRNLSLPTVTI